MGWYHGRELASPDALWLAGGGHSLSFSPAFLSCLSRVAPAEVGLYGYPLGILYLL